MNDSSDGTKLARIEERIDRPVANAIAIRRGGMIAITSMAEVMEVSKLMSIAKQAVPKHLREQPGLCFGVVMQAIAWEMEPFAVARKSYVVNDNLAYESQLLHAVIEARAPLKGRLRCKYSGEGPDRQCTVYGTFDGEDEPHDYTTPKFKDIPIKNSPLWKWDVDQQMFYFGSRSWARKWCPDVLLGVYAPDEAQYAGETSRDITDRVTISNPLQDDAEVSDAPKTVATETMYADPKYYEDPPGAQVDTGDEFDEPAAPKPPKPPRQPRKRAQDAPKPADAPTQPEAENASPAPNTGLLDWRGLDAKALVKKTGADYILYLLMWTNAAVDFKSVPESIRTRYNGERDIRNNLGTPLDANQSAEAKQIAAEAYKKLGGV